MEDKAYLRLAQPLYGDAREFLERLEGKHIHFPNGLSDFKNLLQRYEDFLGVFEFDLERKLLVRDRASRELNGTPIYHGRLIFPGSPEELEEIVPHGRAIVAVNPRLNLSDGPMLRGHMTEIKGKTLYKLAGINLNQNVSFELVSSKE